jgi:hypothetical protein
MVFELTVKDRLYIEEFFPEKSNKMTAFVLSAIAEKVRLSPEEQKDLNFRMLPNGSVSWNDKKEKILKVEFTDVELSTIRECIEKNDKAERLNYNQSATIKKFMA